ncbi:DUF1566 domain-containing protein [Chromatium okenii]|uniref:Lcl C-terminal domain-containing protein n=1 Tax=Chromatium okenii TaxID=61644 RepID=UPI001F5BEAB4|nr:DUF1566 domain-containing protein [Chromatium okenii]
MVDYSRYDPAIDTTQFPNTPSSWFWSGSPIASLAHYAWGVYFGYGYAGNFYRDGSSTFASSAADSLLILLIL